VISPSIRAERRSTNSGQVMMISLQQVGQVATQGVAPRARRTSRFRGDPVSVGDLPVIEPFDVS
jgi:hypothetical protein